MKEQYILLSVGWLSCDKGYGKDFDLLTRLAEELGDDYGIYIVGDESTEESIVWKSEEQLNNLHFVSCLNKEKLAYYFAASDCFVLLMRGDAQGLVINEAMTYGLPIITTPYCVAGTELVENEVNGYLVDLDSVYSIVEKLKTLLLSEKKDSFSLASYKKVKKYYAEKMTETQLTIFGNAGERYKRQLIRESAKAKIGIDSEKKVVLFVGRMIYGKGIDLLLKVAADIGSRREDVLFIFVGGLLPDPFKTILDSSKRDIIRIIPFLTAEELSDYYRSANIFCLPTRGDVWGLVINEAMIFDLPVVTTQFCIAGLELVNDSVNGYIVCPEVNQLSNRIEALLNDEKAWEFGEKSGFFIKDYTIEKMAGRHIEVFQNNK